MLGQEDKLFGLPVDLFLVFMFVVIFVTAILIISPELRGSIVGFLFNGLQTLSKLIMP